MMMVELLAVLNTAGVVVMVMMVVVRRGRVVKVMVTGRVVVTVATVCGA